MNNTANTLGLLLFTGCLLTVVGICVAIAFGAVLIVMSLMGV
jgi:hypothetical protein